MFTSAIKASPLPLAGCILPASTPSSTNSAQTLCAFQASLQHPNAFTTGPAPTWISPGWHLPGRLFESHAHPDVFWTDGRGKLRPVGLHVTTQHVSLPLQTIISEVASNKRPVLLFSPISKSRFLIIIGGTGNDPLVDAQVFEQPMDNMESDCVNLKSSQPLKTRWPAVNGSYQGLFAVPDSTGDNVILVSSDGSSADALNPDTGTVKKLPKLASHDVKILQGSTLLSSTNPVHFFIIQGTDQPQFVPKYFNNPTVDQAEKIADSKESYICSLGNTSSGQQLISVSQTDCQVPIKWNISTGFVNDTSVVLVDEENAVYIFDQAALTSSQQVDVVKIPAETFWQPSSNRAHRGWFQHLPPILRLSIIYGSIFAVFLLLLAAWRYMAPIYRRPRQMDANNEDERSVEMPGTHEEYKALIRAGKKVRRPKYVDDLTFDFACGPRSGEAGPNARFTEEDIAQWMDNLGMARAKQSGKTKKKKQARPLASSASNSVSPLGAGHSAQMVSLKKAAKRSTKQAPVEGKISVKKDVKWPAKPAPVSKKQARRLDYSASTSASPIDVGRSAKKIKRSIKQAPVEVSMKKAAKWSVKPAPVSLKAKVSKSKTKRPPKTSSYKTVKSSQSSLVVYIKANRVDTD